MLQAKPRAQRDGRRPESLGLPLGESMKMMVSILFVS